MATREEGRDILEDWGHHIHTTIYKIDNYEDYSIAHGTLLKTLSRPRWEKNLKRGNVCIWITDSLCCTPEMNTAL